VHNRGGFVTAVMEESSLDQVDEDSRVSTRLGRSIALWSCTRLEVTAAVVFITNACRI